MFTFKKIALVGVAVLTAFSMSCSDDKDDKPPPPEEVELVKKDFTLSFAGKSYGDLDGATTYGQSELGPVKGKIDVVAYHVNNGPEEIINPCYVSTIGLDCGWPELFEIPAKYQTAVVGATTVEEIQAFLDAIEDGEIEGVCDDDGCSLEKDEIDISKNKAFLVMSTEGARFVVIMTDDGAQTVDLSFYKATEPKED
ncbi:MAG: hypothetical protein LBU89_08945 [Fibromonadaceae bacterium]|jgi:hypothetical protein|nr:hypothetical protein [Fibromonadaceae bacterium]